MPRPPRDNSRDKSRNARGRDERGRDARRPEAPRKPGARPGAPKRSGKPFEQRRDEPRPAPHGKPQRFNARDDRAARSERPQRDSRPPRDMRPPRDIRPQRAERPQRGERVARGPRTEGRAEVSVQPWRARGEAGNRGEDRGARFKPRKPWRPSRDPDGPVVLYGWHSVKAALENPARKFRKMYLTENALHRLRDDGIAPPIEPEIVEASEIDAMLSPDSVHQGLLAEADPLPALDISDVPAQGIILVLDQITDPHNVGAILRTAAAFGVTAIVTTQRHSPEATGVLAKAASGALEYMPVVTVPNLARALEALKNNNVFVVGLDSEGDGDIASVPLRTPLALVVGAEGKGLRQLTRATCDQVARLDLPGKIKSLNVSNATALALYVASSRVVPD